MFYTVLSIWPKLMDKVTLPDWAGDDWTPEEALKTKDFETMIVITMKKLNEIVEWINEQS